MMFPSSSAVLMADLIMPRAWAKVAGVGGGGCRLEHELRLEEGQYGLMGALLEHFVAFERLLEVPRG